jgi:hypothetical protein
MLEADGRNILITGLPRSGTTLACHLLNKLPNSVALHEPMEPHKLKGRTPEKVIEAISKFMTEQREQVLTTGTAVSKAMDGKVPANSLDDGDGGKRNRTIDGKTININNVDNASFYLFVKHPSMFTGCLPFLSSRIQCFALIRNPLSVLLSWRQAAGLNITRGRVPAAEAFDADLRKALSVESNILERQFFLLNYFYGRFARFLPNSTIKYEDVVRTRGRVLAAMNPAATALNEPLASRNQLWLKQDPEAGVIAKELLAREGAYWLFYNREEIEENLT